MKFWASERVFVHGILQYCTYDRKPQKSALFFFTKCFFLLFFLENCCMRTALSMTCWKWPWCVMTRKTAWHNMLCVLHSVESQCEISMSCSGIAWYSVQHVVAPKNSMVPCTVCGVLTVAKHPMKTCMTLTFDKQIFIHRSVFLRVCPHLNHLISLPLEAKKLQKSTSDPCHLLSEQKLVIDFRRHLEVEEILNIAMIFMPWHTVVISQTHWLVSQERLSPRAGTSVFIVYSGAICRWWF